MLDPRMSPSLKVLIVDDEPAVLQALEMLFDLHDIPTVTADGPDSALQAVRSGGVGVVVQDMNYGEDKTSGEEGVRLFHGIRELDPELPVLLVTAWASLETAVQLIKAGAADYMSKPWNDDKLVASVRNMLQMRRLQLENRALVARQAADREQLARGYDLCGLIYASDALHQVAALAVKVAPSDAPVMISGPSGAGKEKLAEIVQANSRRRDKPFVRVNVGALPQELMEAELFGAEAGAFTGATGRRIGRFEAADGGTLFLDEIDALPQEGQVKLLRVLQSGEFQRLGSSTSRHADVRVISATNARLDEAIADERFREDLFYRLNVIELKVPPLAERPEDVLPLARHFLEGSGAALDEDAELALLRHGWPGNVRELQNRMQRASLTCGDRPIGAEDLDLVPHAESSAPAEAVEVERAAMSGPLGAERRRIEQALESADGVVARAADALGMSRQALYRRMEKLGIVMEKRLRS